MDEIKKKYQVDHHAWNDTFKKINLRKQILCGAKHDHFSILNLTY